MMNQAQMAIETRMIVPSGLSFPPHLHETVARLAMATTLMTFPLAVMLEPQSGELLCVLTQAHQSVPTEAEMTAAAQTLQQFAVHVAQEFSRTMALLHAPAAQECAFDNVYEVAQTMH